MRVVPHALRQTIQTTTNSLIQKKKQPIKEFISDI